MDLRGPDPGLILPSCLSTLAGLCPVLERDPPDLAHWEGGGEKIFLKKRLCHAALTATFPL